MVNKVILIGNPQLYIASTSQRSAPSQSWSMAS